MTADEPHAEAVSHAVEAHARLRERAQAAADRIRRRPLIRIPDRWSRYS